MDVAAEELAASGPLLGTKLYIPRSHAGLVARTRLRVRLNHGLASRLTLVSAPPGFGKTTLLVESLRDPSAGERRVAWLSLDASDNDPAAFWTYVISALQTVQPGIGAHAISLLQTPQPPSIEAILAIVLNELTAVPTPLVLVIDDYHVIDVAVIHAGLAFLIDHLPPHVHLVIASRADPAVPLARLRARGELTEIRAPDLRFTADEAVTFLNGSMGLALTAQNIAELDARTEGWIAALQLAALSMQGRDDPAGFIAAFTGDDRYIVDYLVEEVLQRQPASVRDFLLKSSILDRLSPALCDAVTGVDGGKTMLEALERRNLFVIPLDDRRNWYRYHHLFAEVLRAHLREEMAEEVPILHRRASEWYAREGQPASAIWHAVAANDLERAASLIEIESEGIVRSHQLTRLIEWLEPIPDDVIRSSAALSTYYAMALQGVGRIEEADTRLRHAEDSIGAIARLSAGSDASSSQGRAAAELQLLSGRIALAQGYQAIASGDLEAALGAAERAQGLLVEDDLYWRGTAALLLARARWAMGAVRSAQELDESAIADLQRTGDLHRAVAAAYHSGDLLKAQGRLREATSMYERFLGLVSLPGYPPMAGVANLHFALSECYCERGESERAAEQLREGERVANFTAIPATSYRRQMATARLRRSHDDIEGSLESMEGAEGLYVRGAVADVRPAGALRARLWIACGRLGEAVDWARREGLSSDDELSYAREFHHLTFARLLIAQSRTDPVTTFDAAARLLDRLLIAAEGTGRDGAVIEVLMLQGLLRARDHLPAACSALERALAMAQPEGYVRLFLDEGIPMRDLLRHAVAAGIGGGYARKLLAAFEPPAARAGASRAEVHPGLAEPMTSRELEILRLVAVGMRNQEIADHLVISLATVKRHIANIYGKLEVGHRTEALNRATELRLL